MSRAPVERPIDRSGPWPFIPWAVPLIAVLLSQLQVIDLSYQLRAGQTMWDSWSLLRSDIFTYTIPGAPWLNQQWGAQIVFSAWFQAGGWRGLIVLQALIVACCYGATFRATVANGASVAVAACATILGFAAAAALPGALALRPQLLALPLFVASAWIIRHRAVSARGLLFLIPLGLVWVNIHGSFVLLPLLLAIAFVADVLDGRGTARWTGVSFAISVIAPWATPWGGGAVYRYIWDLARSPIVRDVITEWQPLWTRPAAASVFLVVCAVGAIVIARRARRAPTLEEAATFLVLTGLAVWSQRNVLWWSVAVPPLAGGLLTGWRPGGTWSRVATRVALGCLAAIIVVGGLRVATAPEDELLTEAPSGITAWLAANPSEGRVFAEWWGWWFEYAVTDEPMFVDARVEVFPQEIWSQYLAIVQVEDGWIQLLDRWEIDTIVLARGHHPAFEAALRSELMWSVAYEDAEGFIFVRP